MKIVTFAQRLMDREETNDEAFQASIVSLLDGVSRAYLQVNPEFLKIPIVDDHTGLREDRPSLIRSLVRNCDYDGAYIRLTLQRLEKLTSDAALARKRVLRTLPPTSH